MISVVVVDLDGTLLRSDTTVSRRTRDALFLTHASGAQVVVATTRPPHFTRMLAAEAGIGGVAVCSNGAVVFDLDTDEVEIVGPLPVAAARRAAEVFTSVVPGAAFAVETGHRSLIGPGYGHVATRDSDRVVVSTFDELWSAAESCVKLLGWSPQPVTDAALKRLRGLLPDLSITHSGGAGMVEIAAPGVSKAVTVARLCEQWGAGPQDVMAFGDMPNDLPVLEWAGTAVAVANAHPLVLDRADRITASNDADGVAIVLEQVFARRSRRGYRI